MIFLILVVLEVCGVGYSEEVDWFGCLGRVEFSLFLEGKVGIEVDLFIRFFFLILRFSLR